MSTKFNSFLNLQTKRVDKLSSIEKLSPIVSKWEGGYVDDKTDKGGATNMGITLGTWKLVGYDKNNDNKIDKEDIKLLTSADFIAVLKKYWNKWRATEIQNQSIANFLVDWYWCSGKWGIVLVQRKLGLDDDGSVGNMTLSKLNEEINKNPKALFDLVYNERVRFLTNIANNSVIEYTKKLGRVPTEKEILKNTQKRFLKGWLNRLNDFKFTN